MRQLVLACIALALTTIASAALAEGPENLARKATASATSEHNGQYLAKFAVDGQIPAAGSQAADRSRAWCVLKAKTGDRADFTLRWPQPVDVSQIVYFGRTAWFMDECFKDFEVYLDDATEPAAHGTLKKMHGPQPIAVPKARVRSLTIKFLTSYGGYNPGALEIQVFADPLSDAQLARKWKATRVRSGVLAHMPWVDQVDAAHLRALIESQLAQHGADYNQAADHLALLDRLQRKLTETTDADQDDVIAELQQLQRDVLLHDVDRLVAIKRHEINASHVYTYHYEGFRAGGGLYVISLDDPAAEPRLLVESPEGQILDCDLSHDGRTILFSWRRRQDEGYHLWTIHVDGTGLTQRTEGEWHDYNACWLPDGDIAFLSTRSPQFAYCWHAPVGILHRMRLDGSDVRRLSANYLNDFTPQVLDSGQIIYSRWEYVDRPAIPIQSLWTINPDGAALGGYFGNRVLSPGTFMEARSIPGTGKIICTMTGHNGPTRGAIGVIDRSRGNNSQAAIENITPDVPVPNVDQGCGNTDGTKQYSCPLPLDAERLLVSIRGPLLVRTLDGSCQSVALEAPDDGMQWLCALPVRPRPRPPVLGSTLPAEAEEHATVYLQDVYDGLEPSVARGEVKTIRVVREMQKTVRIDPSLRAFGFQFPVISCGATYAGKMVLGDVPVDDDGSAYFRVPAGMPIYFMALDGEGRAVQRMRSFTHFMPGETQGCIGCHEHRSQSPRTKPPAVLGEPRTLTPPEWGVGGFDYSKIVQPVLDQYCVECHKAVDPAGGIDLTGDKTDFFNVSYDVLAREKQGRRGTEWVNWIPTYNGQEWNILEVAPKTWGSPASRLAELVLNGHPDSDGVARFAMDPIGRRRIMAWIDLNVPYYGSSETAHPTAPGCRQMVPASLDAALADVARRRCAECHTDAKIPRREWIRVTHPELNAFLTAPLSKQAGGSGRCGQAIFADRTDVDYQKILATFGPITDLLSTTPRMDMPGAEPSCEVNRCCQ